MIKKIDFKQLQPIVFTFGMLVNEEIYRLAKNNYLYYFLTVLLMILAPIFLKFNETIKGNRKIVVLVIYELSLIGLVMIKYFLE